MDRSEHTSIDCLKERIVMKGSNWFSTLQGQEWHMLIQTNEHWYGLEGNFGKTAERETQEREWAFLGGAMPSWEKVETIKLSLTIFRSQ